MLETGSNGPILFLTVVLSDDQTVFQNEKLYCTELGG